MSEYDRLKAQKDAIVAREREAIEQPLRDRIATLEAQLVEVTAERDAAKDMVSRQVGELNTIITKLWKVEGERDAIRKNESEYLTARARGFRACDLDEPLENCAKERYQHEQEGWASGWMERAVQRERDSLRTALRQCGEAINSAHDLIDTGDADFAQELLFKALALPVVQDVLKD